MKIEYIDRDGKQVNAVFRLDQVSCAQKLSYDTIIEATIGGARIRLFFQDAESCNKAFDAIEARISSAEEAQN